MPYTLHHTHDRGVVRMGAMSATEPIHFEKDGQIFATSKQNLKSIGIYHYQKCSFPTIYNGFTYCHKCSSILCYIHSLKTGNFKWYRMAL